MEPPLSLPRFNLRRSPKKIEFTTEEKQYIYAIYQETRSLDYVGRMTGVSPNKIRRELEMVGIPIRTGKEYQDCADKIKHDYQYSDLDIKEMVVKYRVPKNTIFRLAKEGEWKRYVWKRRFFRDVWARKMSTDKVNEKMDVVIQKQRKNSSGENNPMYGRSTPQGAGNGWKGWYKGHYFRSLREVCFMIRMDKEAKKWVTGELLSIPYSVNGVQRTYRPDFIVDEHVYEIKPKKLHNSPAVKAKAEAAIQFCEKRGYVYHLIDEPIQSGLVGRAFALGHIKFDRDYKNRFVFHMTDKFQKSIEEQCVKQRFEFDLLPQEEQNRITKEVSEIFV